MRGFDFAGQELCVRDNQKELELRQSGLERWQRRGRLAVDHGREGDQRGHGASTLPIPRRLAADLRSLHRHSDCGERTDRDADDHERLERRQLCGWRGNLDGLVGHRLRYWPRACWRFPLVERSDGNLKRQVPGQTGQYVGELLTARAADFAGAVGAGAVFQRGCPAAAHAASRTSIVISFPSALKAASIWSSRDW